MRRVRAGSLRSKMPVPMCDRSATAEQPALRPSGTFSPQAGRREKCSLALPHVIPAKAGTHRSVYGSDLKPHLFRHDARLAFRQFLEHELMVSPPTSLSDWR